MDFKLKILLAIFLLLEGGAITILAAPKLPKSVFYIGRSSDGKNFFGDKTPMVWFEAWSYCQSLNMKLASITSAEQLELLKISHSDDFHMRFWTAGRDCWELRQFSWNEDNDPFLPGSPIDSSYMYLSGRFVGSYMTCLLLESVPGGISFYSESCRSQYQVLCENS